jgi:hypothetical protein
MKISSRLIAPRITSPINDDLNHLTKSLNTEKFIEIMPFKKEQIRHFSPASSNLTRIRSHDYEAEK